MFGVYIASPYTIGDNFVNVQRQIDAANKLLDAGLVSITSIPKPSRNAATMDVGRNARSMIDAVVICKKYGINQQRLTK